jgi:hypothetical protein
MKIEIPIAKKIKMKIGMAQIWKRNMKKTLQLKTAVADSIDRSRFYIVFKWSGG